MQTVVLTSMQWSVLLLTPTDLARRGRLFFTTKAIPPFEEGCCTVDLVRLGRALVGWGASLLSELLLLPLVPLVRRWLFPDRLWLLDDRLCFTLSDLLRLLLVRLGGSLPDLLLVRLGGTRSDWLRLLLVRLGGPRSRLLSSLLLLLRLEDRLRLRLGGILSDRLMLLEDRWGADRPMLLSLWLFLLLEDRLRLRLGGLLLVLDLEERVRGASSSCSSSES